MRARALATILREYDRACLWRARHVFTVSRGAADDEYLIEIAEIPFAPWLVWRYKTIGATNVLACVRSYDAAAPNRWQPCDETSIPL